jgi:hypothetical protein
MKTILVILLAAFAAALAGCNSLFILGDKVSFTPIAPMVSSPAPSGYEDRRAELVALRQQGALSDVEFAAAQQKLLATTVFSKSELDRRPSPLLKQRPQLSFPPWDDEGMREIVVDYIVAPDGSVRNVRELTGDNSWFARGWVQAVSTWRYTPGIKDGRAVATEMQVRARRRQGAGSLESPWSGHLAP